MPTIFVGLRLALIYVMINIIALEFLLSLGGLGFLVAEMYDRFDIPGMYAAIVIVMICSILFFEAIERDREMAGSTLTIAPGRKWDRIVLIRLVTLAALVIAYELAARSGLFYRGVIPPLADIGRALVGLILAPVVLSSSRHNRT